MLKIGLSILILTSLINSFFVNGIVVMTQESPHYLTIKNKTTNFFKYIACHNETRVGDRLLNSAIMPNQTQQIPINFINSVSQKEKIIIYLVSSGEMVDTRLIEKKFENSCNFNSSVVAYTNIIVSKNDDVLLTIEGSAISNGLSKTTNSLEIDNTAHLVGTDLSNFYKQSKQKNIEDKLFVPTESGLVYISSLGSQNEFCLDKKNISVSLTPKELNNTKSYIGFIPLQNGKYTISPKLERGCEYSESDSDETINVYENQYAIVSVTSAINPLYKESGALIRNLVDKK
jgi:hypothetical protein